MLKLDNITKVYATKDMKVEALKGISLAFRKSEFDSILGPSGCHRFKYHRRLRPLHHRRPCNLRYLHQEIQ